MNLRPLLIGLGTALVMALGVLAGGLRRRWRAGHPGWARFWDGDRASDGSAVRGRSSRRPAPAAERSAASLAASAG